MELLLARLISLEKQMKQINTRKKGNTYWTRSERHNDQMEQDKGGEE